jgi:hypothetical protein
VAAQPTPRALPACRIGGAGAVGQDR